MEPVEEIKRQSRFLRRLWRGQVRLLQILLTPVALILMLLVTVHFAVNSAFARGQVEDFLGDLFAGEVRITQIKMGIDPRVLHLYGASLLDPNGGEVVHLNEVRAEIDLRVLLSEGRVYVPRIDVTEARTQMIWDRRGNYNLTRALYTGPSRADDPNAKPSTFQLDIENVTVENCAVTMHFPDFEFHFQNAAVYNFNFHLHGGEVTMGADSLYTPHARAYFKPEMFGFSSTGPEAKPRLDLTVQKLRAEKWDWKDNGFTLGRFRMESDGGSFDVTDGLMRFADEGMHYGGLMGVRVPANFAPIEYFSGPLLESPLEVTMAASGLLGSEMNIHSYISAGVDLELADLKVKGLNFDRGHVKAQLVNRHLYLLDLDLIGYEGEVHLSEEATGDLPEWAAASHEPSVVPNRAWLSLLDLSYRMPVVVDGLDLEGVLKSVAPPELDPSVLVPAHGKLSLAATATGRLIDTQDPERLSPLPAFHKVQIDKLHLHRTSLAATDPAGIIPTRHLELVGDILFRQNRLTTLSPLRLVLDGDQIAVSDLELDLNDTSRLPVHANLSAEVDSVGRYLRHFGVEGIDGAVSLSVRADGPLLDPRLSDGVLRVHNPELVGFPGEEVFARFELREGWLSISEARALGRFGRANARGRVRIYEGSLSTPSKNPVLDLRFDADPIDLSVVRDLLKLDFPLEGLLVVESGEISGSALKPDIKAHIESDGLLVMDQPIQSVTADVEVSLASIKVDNLDLRLGREGSLKGAAVWGFQGGVLVDLALRGLKLSEITALRQSNLEGDFKRLDLHLEGELDPGRIKATAVPPQGGPPATSGGDILRWITTEPLDFHGNMALTDFLLEGQNMGSVVGAWDTLEQAISVNLIVMPFVSKKARHPIYANLNAVEDGEEPKLFVRQSYPETVGVEIYIPQTLDDPYITVDTHFQHLNVRGVVMRWLNRGKATAWGEELGKEVHLEANQIISRMKRGGKGRSRIADLLLGDLGESPSPETSAATEFEKSLSAWGEMLLGGHVEVDFNRRDMSYVAEAFFPEFTVSALGRTLASPKPVQIGFQGDNLVVESFTLGTEERFVEFGGSVSLGAEGTAPVVDASLKGDLDVALFNLVPGVVTSLQGVAGVDLKVKGAVDKLHPHGTIRFSRDFEKLISFRLRGLKEDVVLEGGTIAICAQESGRLDAEVFCKGRKDGAVVITEDDPIEVSMLSGKLLLFGEVGFADFSPKEVVLNVLARNLAYQVPGVMNVSFHVPDMQLRLQDLNDPSTWSLKGEVDLFDGRYFQELHIISDLIRNTAKGGAQKVDFPLLDQIPLLRFPGVDLTIRSRDGFQVEGSVDVFELDLELKTDLRITKKMGERLSDSFKEVNMEGNLDILPGGQILRQGKAFSIQKGNINWTGDLFNPRFDFLAEYTVENACASVSRAEGTDIDDAGTNDATVIYTITFASSGTPRNFDYSFNSTPYVEQSDIVSLLGTGCTTDQLTASSASSPLGSLLLQPILNDFGSELGKFIEVEELKLTSDLSNTTVSFNEHITNRFVLRFSGSLNTGDEETSGYRLNAGARYFILDNFYINLSERSEENEELKLELDFRLRLHLPE